MARGVYERKPHMANFGKLHGQREYIITLHREGAGAGEIAKAYGVAKASIQAVIRGNWNPGRAA